MDDDALYNINYFNYYRHGYNIFVLEQKKVRDMITCKE